MKPFGYLRAASVEEAVRACAGHPGARYLGGGTNLVDLMKLGVERPGAARRRHPAAARPDRGTAGRAGCASARRSATATSPPHPAVRDRYPGAVAGAARRRLGAAAQHRHHRRQPAPAHPLPVLPGHLQALQQARARAAAARPARAPTATSPSSATPSTASPPTPRTWPWRWPPSTPPCRAARPRRATAAVPVDRVPPAARRPPRPGHRDPARRTDHRRARCPPRPRRRRSALPQGPRPRLVRLRPGLRRRRARGRTTASYGDAALAFGGLAHRPWRARAAEEVLRGAPATADAFARAADAELAAARPLRDNALQGAARPQPGRRRAGRLADPATDG